MQTFSKFISQINKINVVDRIQLMQSKSKGKKVLHIGCTGGPVTEAADDEWVKAIKNTVHYKIMQNSKELVGIDVNPLRLNKMSQFLPNGKYYVVDITTIIDQSVKNEIFDFILFPEVIEHIHDMTLTFENIKHMMNFKTQVLISTPNAFSLGNLIRTCFGKETNHPEHVALYSLITLENLLHRFGFKVVEVYYARSSKYCKNKIISLLKMAILKVFPQLNSGIIYVVEKS